jgi:hypothetical protein
MEVFRFLQLSFHVVIFLVVYRIIIEVDPNIPEELPASIFRVEL